MHYCSHEKGTVGLFFEKNWWTTVSGEENHWSTVLKRTGALLFSGEGNHWSADSRELVHYCFQENETIGRLFQENWCTTVFKRRKPSV